MRTVNALDPDVDQTRALSAFQEYLVLQKISAI